MATRYWVGGSGNWSDSTNHWAASSGGSPNVANTPTHIDNVVFDSLSNATAYTVTMDKQAFCADMTWGNPLVGAPTWAGSVAMQIWGSLSLVSGMAYSYTGGITFKSTSTGKTITMNTVTGGSAFTFEGVGGGWTLQDTCNIGSSIITNTAGTLDTNGVTVTCGGFNSTNVNTRVITLGASIINCTGVSMAISDNLTLNANTSSIRVTGSGAFSGGGKTFYEVQLNGTAHTVSGANTFTTLTRTGTATKTDTLTLSANQTVSGTLTLVGNSATNRLLVQSNIKGTAYTLTAATVTASNLDLQDITGAGAGSWNLSAITGKSGDCGGNTNITFTTGINQYFQAGTSQNWSTAGNWYLATNGGGGAGYVPLPQDTAIFDANSITAGSVVITQDMPRIGSVNWTGSTNTPTWTTSTAASVFGSITLISGMTLTASTQLYTIQGRGNYGITSATKTWAKGFTIDNASSTWTLQDTFNVGSGVITLQSGNFDTNGQTVTSGAFNSNSSSIRSLTLGSSTINCTTWGMANTDTNFTLNAGTSIIKVTGVGAFTGSGVTYYEVQLNGTSHTVSGENTFTTLTRTGTATKTDSITFTNNQTISGVLTLAGNSATNRLLVKGTQVTLTVNTTVTASNVDIQDMLGAGSASWNLSAITGNSGDCGGNSGITFTTPVTTNWVSGATWSTATWSSRVPLPQDTATFTTAGVATITQDMPRIGSVDFSTSADKTWTTSTTCSYFGSIDLTNLTTLTASTQVYTYEGRGSSTLTTAGKSWAKQMNINAPGGALSLADLFTVTNTSGINFLDGTLTASSSGVTATLFNSTVTTTRVLNMGSGTWTMTSTSGSGWILTGTLNLTINPSTSTIKFTGALTNSVSFQGGGATYNNFWNATTNAFACIISGSNTFNDFKTDAGRIVNFTAFTIQTVTTFTAIGTLGNVITLQSTTTGSRAYIKDTIGTNTSDYLSIRDIGVTGGATWNEGANSTFVSGNIGWAGNPAVNRYWVSGGDGYWDSTTNWSLTSGGASGASVPVGENVFFDANSGSGEVMIASAPLVNNLDCTGFTGTFIGTSAFTAIYGNMTLVSGMTLLSTGAMTFRVNNSSKTLTTGTKTLLGTVTFDIISDTITPQDAITSNSSLTHTSGTVDFNNLNHSFTTFASTNSNTRTITMGSGTMTLTGTGTVWNMATITGLTLNQNTSTIKITDATSQTKTFSGGGETFYNIWCTGSGTGAFNFVGSNTFNDFKVDTPPHSINFTAGTTTTVTTFTVSGTVGNLMTIGSITSAAHTLTKSGGGTISSDYLSISYSTATPATTWYAGANSTDGGNNSGWSFTAPIGTVSSNFFLLFN